MSNYRGKIDETLYNLIIEILRKDTSFRTLVNNINNESNKLDRNPNKSVNVFGCSFSKRSINIFSNLILGIIIVIIFLPLMYSAEISDILEKVFDIGFTVSITLLGFLITGYAIYTAFMNKEFAIFLMLSIDDDKKSNSFRQINLIFLKPFVVIIYLLVISIIGKIASLVYPHMVSVNFIESSSRYHYLFNFTYCGYIILFFLYLKKTLENLKVFIYNLYHISIKIAEFIITAENLGVDIDKLITRYNKAHND